MSTKRSADDTNDVSVGGAGVATSCTTASVCTNNNKRIKTIRKDTATPAAELADAEPKADPVKSVLTNPDTLSKSLLCLDVKDIASAARTCKVWNSTLDDIEEELWLGLVRKHHPTLETIKAMMSNGDDTSWRDMLKRRRTIKAPDWRVYPPSPKPLDAYAFEVICEPYVADGKPSRDGELATVVKSAVLHTKSLSLVPVRILDGPFVVSVRIYDRSSGRQAMLLDDWFVLRFPSFNTSGDTKPVGGIVHCRSEDSEQVEVKWYAEPRLFEEFKQGHDIVLDLKFKVNIFQRPYGGRGVINESAHLASSQILDILQNHLDWK